MTYIKDISDKRYSEITGSAYTPSKLKQDWDQKVKERQPTVQLFITKNFDLNSNEYHLLVGIPRETTYIILSYQCQQPPTYVISDICHILVNHFNRHANNTYLVNQFLNANGYKNLEHIVMDIFTQEMGLQMGQKYLTDAAFLFSDYLYLIQKSLSDIHAAINSLDLGQEGAQSFFFFLLTVEESIKKLNQEFMFLYFCFYKMADENRHNKGTWEAVLRVLKKSYFQRIDHHINVIKASFIGQRENLKGSNWDTQKSIVNSVAVQLENLLQNLEVFQQKEAYVAQTIASNTSNQKVT